MSAGNPAPGWYPDRPDAPALRWWDGETWTDDFHEHVAPAAHPEPVVAAPAAAATSPAPLTRRELRERVGGALTQAPVVVAPAIVAAAPAPVVTAAASTPVVAMAAPTLATAAPAAFAPPAASAAYAPAGGGVALLEREETPEVVETPAAASFSLKEPALSSGDLARVAGGYEPRYEDITSGSNPRAAFSYIPPRSSAQTLPGWLLATSPLWIGLGTLAALVSFASFSPLILQAGLGLVSLILVIALAKLDTNRLAARDFTPPATAWVLIPLVYFILRIVRAGARSAGMLVAYLASQALFVMLVLVAAIAQPALFAPLLALESSLVEQGTGIDTAIDSQADALPTDAPVVLTDQQRAEILTEAGTESTFRRQLEQGWQVGSLDCQPFPAEPADASTTCQVELDGILYDAGLKKSPDDPSNAFSQSGMIEAGVTG